MIAGSSRHVVVLLQQADNICPIISALPTILSRTSRGHDHRGVTGLILQAPIGAGCFDGADHARAFDDSREHAGDYAAMSAPVRG